MFTQAQPVQLIARPFKHKVMLHEELWRELRAGEAFYCKRATLVISQLVVNPEHVSFKGTIGDNKGWRRTPLGGNGGSHYYLWWTTSGSPPAKGYGEEGEGEIYYVRCTRHHDDTDQTLSFGALHYSPLTDRLALEELPSPWTPDQLSFIKASSEPVRLLKGTPGTGKTTSLWRAVDEALDARVLYLTWSKQLADNARAHFELMTSAHTQVDAQHLSLFFQRLQDDTAEGEIERLSLSQQRERFASRLSRIRDHRLRAEIEGELELYFGLVRAWVIGRAPWGEARASEALYSRADLVARAQEQGTEEVKARFNDVLRELKEGQDEAQQDEAQQKGRDAQAAERVTLDESEAEAAQEEALLRSWDRVIREPLEKAKRAYQAMKLSGEEEAELFPELSLARSALARLHDKDAFAEGELRELFPYQKVVIDEVQDLTPLELEVVVALCQRLSYEGEGAPTLLVAGDEGQIIRPTYFEWRELSQQLYHSLARPSAVRLQANLRSPALIVDTIAHLKRLEQQLPKALQARGQGNTTRDLEANALVALSVCEHTDEAISALIELSEQPNVAFIYLDEERPEWLRAHEMIWERLVSPAEAKGLEYASVCLLGLSSALQRLSREYAEENPLAYFLRVNHLRVALSRATQHLWALEVNATPDALTLTRDVISPQGEQRAFVSYEELTQPFELTPQAALEHLAPQDQAVDERVSGFLREADRSRVERPRLAWGLVKHAEHLIKEYTLDDQSLVRQLKTLRARLLFSQALHPSERWLSDKELKEAPSVIQSDLGPHLSALLSALVTWGGSQTNGGKITRFFERLDDLDPSETPAWLSAELAERGRALTLALERSLQSKTYAKQLTSDVTSWLTLVGFTQEEAAKRALTLKRAAFDTLMSAGLPEDAERVWRSVRSTQREDLGRKVSLFERQGHYAEAASLLEEMGEFSQAFKTWREAGEPQEARRLIPHLSPEERASLDRLELVIALLKEEPLSAEEKALLISEADEELSAQRARYKKQLKMLSDRGEELEIEVELLREERSEYKKSSATFNRRLAELVEREQELLKEITERERSLVTDIAEREQVFAAEQERHLDEEIRLEEALKDFKRREEEFERHEELLRERSALVKEQEDAFLAQADQVRELQESLTSERAHVSRLQAELEAQAQRAQEALKHERAQVSRLQTKLATQAQKAQEALKHERAQVSRLQPELAAQAQKAQEALKRERAQASRLQAKLEAQAQKAQEALKRERAWVSRLQAELAAQAQKAQVTANTQDILPNQKPSLLFQPGDLVNSTVKGVEFKMVWCPAGIFWMGSEEGVGGDDEHPKQCVQISKPFLMGQTQVTQELWEAVMGSNPSDFEGDLHPVENISWYDMARFCNALSALENFRPAYSIGAGDTPDVGLDFSANGYRMPTAAEWEYAAKAGTEWEYAGADELKQVGWFGRNSGLTTHPVALKTPNEWGLYDMSGNVWEWCSDKWDGDADKSRTKFSVDPYVYAASSAERVRCGGSWSSVANNCRVALHCGFNANRHRRFLGGRLLRSNLDS